MAASMLPENLLEIQSTHSTHQLEILRLGKAYGSRDCDLNKYFSAIALQNPP